MKNTPKGWPRISPSIAYDDAPAAIDWLCRAFGFEVRSEGRGRQGTRSCTPELVFGDGVVMVGSATTEAPPEQMFRTKFKSPRSVGGVNSAVTHALCR